MLDKFKYSPSRTSSINIHMYKFINKKHNHVSSFNQLKFLIIFFIKFVLVYG